MLLCPGVSEKYAAAKVLNAVGIFAKIRKKRVSRCPRYGAVIVVNNALLETSLHIQKFTQRASVAPEAVWQVWRPLYQSEIWYGGAIRSDEIWVVDSLENH